MRVHDPVAHDLPESPKNFRTCVSLHFLGICKELCRRVGDRFHLGDIRSIFGRLETSNEKPCRLKFHLWVFVLEKLQDFFQTVS